MRPRLLDLFCGAGGAAMGYYRAGFEVVGVDIEPQKHYPFEFHQADAMTYPLEGFDVIHASPPCQGYSAMQNIHKNSQLHPALISPIRMRLLRNGKPYIIENVRKSPLKSPIMLCGSMFNLKMIRHRYFESPWIDFQLLPACNHGNVYDPWHGAGRTAEKFREAIGIDWMPMGGGRLDRKGSRSGTVTEAIPPAYTEWVGRQLLEAL